MALRPMKPCCAPGCGALVRGARYCQSHEHLAEAWATSKRAERTGLTGRPWRRLREKILKRDSYLCQYCLQSSGRVTVATEVDHRLAVAFGGDDSESNLVSTCSNCHLEKTKKESSQARRKV